MSNTRFFCTLLMLGVVIFLFGFKSYAFAEEYSLYQKNLGDFSITHILRNYIRGIELNKDAINSYFKRYENTKNIKKQYLDINICDRNYSSGIRIFKVYKNDGMVVGFVIVSYDEFFRALLTPVFIKTNYPTSLDEEDQLAFNLISIVGEFIESTDKISIPGNWIKNNKYFKQLIDEGIISYSIDSRFNGMDRYVINLKKAEIKKLALNVVYNVSEVAVFSYLGEKLLNDTILSQDFSVEYKLDLFKRLDINYQELIPVLEQIEILKQKLYPQYSTISSSTGGDFYIQKEASIINYLRVSRYVDKDSFLEYYEMLVKEKFGIRKIYTIISNKYFYEEKEYKLQGIGLLVELFPFLSKDQVIEMQKIVLRNEEFLSMVLWDINDMFLKKQVINNLLWLNNEYARNILFNIFDKYKRVTRLKYREVKLILAILDFIYENNFSIKEIEDIVRQSSWRDTLDAGDLKKINDKIKVIIKNGVDGYCSRFFI